jgi:hypothetical protein
VKTSWRPRQESNLRTRFRKPMLYPLSYGGSDADARYRRAPVPNGSAAGGHSRAHGPSPPDAVHERGSQGFRASFELLGALKRPLVELVVVVVVGGAVVVVVVVVPFDDLDFLGPGVVAGFGGLTEKLVPVSTVTSALPSTMEGL